MKTYGLLGKNINYSLSPAMHNAAFKALGMDAEYKIFDRAENELESFFSDLKKGTVSGCNVTIPYKEKVLDFVDEKSPAAKYIGALNTVANKNGILWGHNTDYQGFMKSLKSGGEGNLNFDPEGKDAFVFGAGGAAKAVIYVLQRILGIKRIIIADIDNKKAEKLADSIIKKEAQNAVITIAQDEGQYNEFVSRVDLLVNATPCGMEDGDEHLFDYSYIHEKLYVFDLVYTNDTPLVKEARARNARAINGQNMLLYQAAAAFTTWTGKEPPLDVMRKALLERIGK